MYRTYQHNLQYTSAYDANASLENALVIARVMGHRRPKLSDMGWNIYSDTGRRGIAFAQYVSADKQDAACFLTNCSIEGNTAYLGDYQPQAYSEHEWTVFRHGLLNQGFPDELLSPQLSGQPVEQDTQPMFEPAGIAIAPTERRLTLLIDSFTDIRTLSLGSLTLPGKIEIV